MTLAFAHTFLSYFAISTVRATVTFADLAPSSNYSPFLSVIVDKVKIAYNVWVFQVLAPCPQHIVQCDHSALSKPPVDIDLKVVF